MESRPVHARPVLALQLRLLGRLRSRLRRDILGRTRRLLHDVWPKTRVRGVDPMKTGEVGFGWWRQGNEPTHQRLRRQREGLPAFRGVLVPTVIEAPQSALSDGSSRSIAAQPLETVAVIRMHERVGVQREALGHSDAILAVSGRQLERQPFLNRLLLQHLKFVICEGRFRIGQSFLAWSSVRFSTAATAVSSGGPSSTRSPFAAHIACGTKR